MTRQAKFDTSLELSYRRRSIGVYGAVGAVELQLDHHQAVRPHLLADAAAPVPRRTA